MLAREPRVQDVRNKHNRLRSAARMSLTEISVNNMSSSAIAANPVETPTALSIQVSSSEQTGRTASFEGLLR